MPKVESIDKKAIIDRLHRLEGQIRALERLIEEGSECEQVLTQFAAARAAFQKVGVQVLSVAMKECVLPEESGASEEAVDKALALFQQFARHLQ
ncbi:MAG: metal-sensitive transcriptional regulator [Candidatus Aquicultorales bacterium]